jgi:prepilin peptidase CpaA
MEMYAVAFAAACAVGDVRTRRIPNLLTGPVLIGALALHAVIAGSQGISESLLGAGLALSVLLLPFALGGIGGGDVKMMVAVGAVIGPRATARALALGMILGGVWMLGHLARRGRLLSTVRSMRDMLLAAVLTRSADPLRTSAERPSAIALPYAVPLGLATIAVVVLGSVLRG